jgi:hypothetical protein
MAKLLPMTFKPPAVRFAAVALLFSLASAALRAQDWASLVKLPNEM